MKCLLSLSHLGEQEPGRRREAFARGSHGQSVVEMRYEHKESKLEPFSAIDA